MSSSSASPVATGIPADHLGYAWPGLWPLVRKAWEKSDDKSEILTGLRDRRFQLWGVYDRLSPVAGIVTRLVRHTTSGELHCHVWLVGGSRLSAWAPDFVAKLLPWAKSEGCVAVTGNGRLGWSRIMPKLGFSRVDDLDGLPCWKRAI